MLIKPCRYRRAQVTEESIERTFATNTKGVVYAFKYQLPAIESSGGHGAVLVNTSCGGTRAFGRPESQGSGVYAASKAAANMLAQYAVSV
jgi:NAD(P)-dependent dehydrogenase (short-subunit alcohol dehydrogenase family)